MKNLKTFFAHKIFKVLKWVVLILVLSFIILTIVRAFHYVKVEKVEEQVLKIHSTKLEIRDVTGENLPPDPGLEADKTIEGIDANTNGIRDDVEIAIFKEYPQSAKTRAVLLQYALALQMETTQPFVNEEVVTKVAIEQGRADTCLSDTVSPRKTPESSRNDNDIEKISEFISFVEEKQLNTESRKDARNNFYKNLRSYGESTNNIVCDIDLSKLPN